MAGSTGQADQTSIVSEQSIDHAGALKDISLSLELLRFEGPAPLAVAEVQQRSTAAEEVLRPRSGKARLLALPATAIAAGKLAVHAAASRLARRSRPKFDNVLICPPDQAGEFHEATGARIRKGVIYARHPKLARNHVVIPAPALHQHLIKEQIGEIIRFLRSELRVSSVRITVRSEKSGKVLVGSLLKGMPVLARLGFRSDQSVTLEQRSRQPKRVPSREPYVWIDDFPEIKAAAKSARHGKFVAVQSTDMRFGLTAPAAKFANINADWLTTFVFVVEAEYR